MLPCAYCVAMRLTFVTEPYILCKSAKVLAPCAYLFSVLQGGGASDGIGLPSAKEVAMMLARVACNCMTICDEELNPIGADVKPFASLIP